MGIVYRDVVDTCLKGDFDSPEFVDGDASDYSSVILKFAKTVVERLGTCLV